MHKGLRIGILLLFLLLLGGSLALLPTLKFAFSFESFYPEDDEEFEYYKTYKEKFRTDQQSLLVHFHRETGVLDRAYLKAVKSYTRKCAQLPHILKATSIATHKDFLYDPLLPRQVPLLHLNDPAQFSKDSTAILRDPRMLNTFLSEDGKTLAVMLVTDTILTFPEKVSLKQQLDSLTATAQLGTDHTVGFLIGDVVIMGQQQQEFQFYLIIATLLILVSMTLLFRRWIGVFVAFVSVIASMVIFFGLMALMGRELDLLSSIYPILLVIVGTSDVVHLMTKYVDELNQGKSKSDAVKIAIKEIGLATFMTSLTTAIGFASLYSSNLPPIKVFGLTAALGVFLAYLTVILFTTALMSFFDAEQLIRPGKGNERFRKLMDATNDFTKHRPRSISIGTILLLVLAFWGVANVSTNVYDTRDIPRNSKFKADFDFVDEEMKGNASIELMIEAGEGHTLEELPVMQELARFEAYLNTLDPLGPIYSPTVLFKNANRAYHLNLPEFYTLPDSAPLFDRQVQLLHEKSASTLHSMITPDGKNGRFAVKVRNIGSDKVSTLNAQMDEWMDENMNANLLTLRHTGSKYLFDKNQTLLVKSLIKSLGLAFIFVSIFMALIFGNLKLILISLIPNVIPLILTGALVGFIGFGLDAKVAITFTIAFGIAVDDTIHFLSKFKLEQRKGKNIEDALQSTFRESGKAICITSIILLFGFSSLSFSVFPPTQVMGILIGFTMVGALVADLLLTPVLIRWMLKD